MLMSDTKKQKQERLVATPRREEENVYVCHRARIPQGNFSYFLFFLSFTPHILFIHLLIYFHFIRTKRDKKAASRFQHNIT